MSEHRSLLHQTTLADLLDSLVVGVFRAGADGRLLAASPALLRILGLEEGVAGRFDLASCFVRAEDREGLLARLQAAGGVADHELEVRRADGSRAWVAFTGRMLPADEGEIAVVEGIVHELVPHRPCAEQLAEQALHDSLTGLANRELFIERLDRAVDRARRSRGVLFAVLHLDLDRFRVINESLGHEAGDRLLAELAGRLGSVIPPGATLARIGGDEFAILLDDLPDLKSPAFLTDRIHTLLRDPFNLDGREVFTSAAVGIALGTGGYIRTGDVLRDAEIAMYRAKARGQGRSAVVNRETHAETVALRDLEHDLRRALDRDELALHFQPIISLNSGRITGLEALMRWRHPERGPLGPEQFIPVAEESGLIVPLGRWALGAACRQMRAFQQEMADEGRSLTVSVNISGRQFVRRRLVQEVQEALDTSGLAASSLVLEITESILMDRPDTAEAVLAELRELGLRVHLDDFGTGYSSLGYLSRFPIDALKIDRSFVWRIGAHGENLEIVRAIVSLARNLGMSAVAEGVETTEQLVQLRALQCSHAQGDLFGPAADAETTLALLQSETRW